MKNTFINISRSGCLFSSGGASFLIDPGSGSISMLRCMYKKPDSILFSGAHKDVASEFPSFFAQNNELLYYSSAMTKKLIGKQQTKFSDVFSHAGISQKNFDDEIIDCNFKKSITVNRDKENCAKIFFRPCGTFPGMSMIFIKTQEDSLLYTPSCLTIDGTLEKPDYLVMRANSYGMNHKLDKYEKVVVQVESFSGLFDILQYLNGRGKGVRAGIDKTVIQPACEYLKMGYPVFSKYVRPLSEFDKMPRMVLTTKPGLYEKNNVVGTDYFAFCPGLSEIYSFCKKINPTKAIVYSDKIEHSHRRGNIIFSKSYQSFQADSVLHY